MTQPRNPLDDIERIRARKSAATAKAGQAYLRLLQLAEAHHSDQARHIAAFLASLYDGQAFALDPFSLRLVDEAIADDMLACLDALRWAQAELHTLVPNGQPRLVELLARWGLRWPDPG